jgi:hypothetical protein
MAKIAYYLVCALIIVTIGMLMVGCEQVPKIQMDIWSFDSSDGTVYRRLDNGNEQFFYCTSKVAESYHAMHKDDLQKWFVYFRTRCKCN